MAAHHAHEEEQSGQDHGPAEVRLEQEQTAQKAGDDERRQEAHGKGPDHVLLFGEKIGEVEDQGDLGKFQGLQIDRTQIDPAAGTVDAHAPRG